MAEEEVGTPPKEEEGVLFREVVQGPYYVYQGRDFPLEEVPPDLARPDTAA